MNRKLSFGIPLLLLFGLMALSNAQMVEYAGYNIGIYPIGTIGYTNQPITVYATAGSISNLTFYNWTGSSFATNGTVLGTFTVPANGVLVIPASFTSGTGLYEMNNLTNGNGIAFILSSPNSSLISAYYNSTYDYQISNTTSNLTSAIANLTNQTLIQNIVNESFVYGNNSTTTILNIASELDALNTSTANLTASYNSLNSSLQTIDGSIATLTSGQANAQNEISGLTNSIATLSNTTNGIISNFNSFANLTNSSLYTLQSEYVNENATMFAGFKIVNDNINALFSLFDGLVVALVIVAGAIAIYKFFKSKPKGKGVTLNPIHEEAKKEIIKEEITKKAEEELAKQSKEKLKDLQEHKKKVDAVLDNSDTQKIAELLSKYNITDPEIIRKVELFRKAREKLDKTEGGKTVPNESIPEYQELKTALNEAGIELKED